jgi:NAD-dependent SIR2 family protein deacetylase
MTSLKRFEGELVVDNRAGGAIPGVTPRFGEFSTLRCWHCSAAYIKNPNRIRPREFCRKCNNYICDHCGAAAAKPDYVHRSFDELTDLVRNGTVSIVGGTASEPILIPTGVIRHG